eukprot:TRINITY_DN12806_c1_g2_i1.p1 TRINITY_DN12806_c1_g2~~TRINITY_DN12806_c1_g2_i1.p1  ORF type:complete len:587 (-),score=129.98 TRINITY_DN12806_c1_g2_i1:18-1778(-)
MQVARSSALRRLRIISSSVTARSSIGDRGGRLQSCFASGSVRHASSRSEEHYDIITIGSGGGAKVSTPAANLGFKVAMIEHGFDAFGEHLVGLGGTCLTRGCIPSKMLIHPADVVTELAEAERFGIKAEYHGIDFEKLVQRVCDAVDGDSKSILPGYQEKNPFPDRKHLYTGTAKFVGPKTVQVTGSKLGQPDKTISADYIFLAAGAVPQVPPIPGLKGTPFLTSTEALRLKQMPKKLIVIGAGYIATELGHMYGALGTEVHMMARSELLRTMDVDARKEFSRVFSERYNLHTGVTFKEVQHDGKSFSLRYSCAANGPGDLIMEADQLLVCTGVDPVGPQLDLQNTGVELKEKGFVQVDGCLRTKASGIWSYGDLAGNYLFRHCANFEGEYLMEHVVYPLALAKGLLSPEQTALLPTEVVEKFSPEKAKSFATPEALADALSYPPLDYDQGMPWAVFSNPQVAGIGFSEDELIAKGMVEGKDYIKGINNYASSAMGDARLSDHGFVKILVEVKTRKILGCVVVGYEASTMVHQVIPVMRERGRLEDCLYMIYIHPALPEIFRNACRKARDALVKCGAEVPLKLRLK